MKLNDYEIFTKVSSMSYSMHSTTMHFCIQNGVSRDEAAKVASAMLQKWKRDGLVYYCQDNKSWKVVE